jgi:hypothetical protein
MPTGLSNQPRLLKGAFVDSELVAVPPLIVPFQFNPETITRRRSSDVQMPPSRRGHEELATETDRLEELQTTVTSPESMSLDIRLDASDAMEKGDAVAGELGVLPALSTLELMITPRSETVLGGILGLSIEFGFGDRRETPALLFVWGRQRIYLVRLTELEIQEVEYNPQLNPTRAVVSVGLQVITGGNPFHVYTQLQRDIHAGINLRNAPDVSRSVVKIA